MERCTLNTEKETMKQKIKKWLLLALLPALHVSICGCGNESASVVADDNVTFSVSLDADRSAGRMPRVLKPSAFTSWNEEIVSDFIDDAGKSEIGMVRLSIETELLNSRNEQDFLAKIRSDSATAKACKEVVQEGGIVLMQISGTPKWLRQPSNRSPYFWQGTPTDMDAWYRIVQEMAKHFKENVGLNDQIWYEFSNEPDNKGEWQWHGTAEAFMLTYAATANAVKSIDPQAKVGAAGVLSYAGSFTDGGEPVIKLLIEYCGAHHTPLDFVSWHFFGVPILINTHIVPTIKQWLRENGFDEDLAQIVSEYNPLSNYPLSYDPKPAPPNLKDGEVGGAAIGKMLYELYRGGIYGCSLSLGDTGRVENGDFQNGFGAKTHKHLNNIKKPMYHVAMMYASPYFGRNMVQTTFKTVHPYDIDPPLYALSGINDERTKLSLVIGNYIEAPVAIAMHHLTAHKGRTMSEIDSWGGQQALTDYYDGRIALDGLTTDAPTQADIISAQPYFDRYQKLLTTTHRTLLEIKNFDADAYMVSRYLVDATYSNAYFHYWANHNDIDAAVKNQELEMIERFEVKSLADIKEHFFRPFSQSLIVIEKIAPPLKTQERTSASSAPPLR
ncbi:MAG: hypothetical protein JXK05_07200 [Campylobacterales bacterium]|nr:hypothetical protein [Campylobacterales bacterium]